METDIRKTVFFLIFSSLIGSILYSQNLKLFDGQKYDQVFVDTDNFGVSYLANLEETYPSVVLDTLKFKMVNDLAYYWHTRNLNRALHFSEKGLQLAETAKNTLWKGRFQITEAAILLRMEKLDIAENLLNEAMPKVTKKDLPHLYTQLGYVYERRGELGKAADYAMKALKIGKSLSDIRAIAMAYSDLSNLFWKQRKYEAGLEYGLKSLSLYEKRGINDLDYDFTLFVVASNYLSLGKTEKALTHLQHSIAIGERYGFYNNLSDAYIVLVEVYTDLDELDKAEKAGRQALKYAELLDNNFMSMRSWLSLGKVKNRQRQFTEAIKLLQTSIETATNEFGDTFYLSQAYDELAKAYAGNRQFKDAYTAFTKYDTLKSTVFTAEADKRISLLRTEFEVADKEVKIQSQEALISKQKTAQQLIMVITALLLLLLLLAYISIHNKFKVNKLLKKQNIEKEFLLKEIHHRVKNNLEIVSSLLSLQAAKIDNPNILSTIQESQHRVQSIGMIHQKLYTGENLAAVEMKSYFESLGSYILDAFGATDRVKLLIPMPSLELDVDMAIPIGLIVNELLTNSLKYAFSDDQKGEITLSIKPFAGKLQLEVSDNGGGKKPHLNSNSTGFGTQLISLLIKQLDGKMNLNIQNGTSISIQFQYPKAA